MHLDIVPNVSATMQIDADLILLCSPLRHNNRVWDSVATAIAKARRALTSPQHN